jgi:hypothetical protein
LDKLNEPDGLDEHSGILPFMHSVVLADGCFMFGLWSSFFK